MMSAKERYAELIALTQIYLLQEHSPEHRLFASSDTYGYFRDYALKQKQNPQTLPTPAPIPVARPAPIPQAASPSPLQAKPIPPTPVQEVKPVEVTPIGKAIKEPIKQEQPAEPKKKSSEFHLEPFNPPAPSDFKEIRALMRERFPNVALLDKVPDDAEARKPAKAWERPAGLCNVLILSLDEISKHRTFLGHIATALEATGHTTAIIAASGRENSIDWESTLASPELRLVLITGHGLEALPELSKLYREEAKQARRYLGKIPLLLLSDIGFYLKEPQLKQSLWSALKECLPGSKAL